MIYLFQLKKNSSIFQKKKMKNNRDCLGYEDKRAREAVETLLNVTKTLENKENPNFEHIRKDKEEIQIQQISTIKVQYILESIRFQ